MKKLLFLIPLFLIVQLAYAEVSIENDQKYIDQDKALHIVGEIENKSTTPLNKIQIFATLIDDNGNVIGKTTDGTVSNVIMPGMKGVFDIFIKDIESELVTSYQLDFDYNIAKAKNQVIEITSSTLTKDNQNNTIITGILKNKGEITANMVKVIATLYDREGNVVTVSQVYTKPDFIRSGDKVGFLIPFHEKTQSIHAVDYNIIAESDEYVVVPEFPLGTGILLVLSVSSYILFSRNPEKVVNIISNVGNTKKLFSNRQD